MSRTGVGCRVMIDGAQLDDGCINWANPPDYPQLGQGVTADDGLKITWGRSTVLEQPQPSSCHFTLSDEPGGVGYMNVLRVGAQVEVWADALLPGEAAGSAFIDGDYETRTPPGTPSAAVLTWTSYRAHAGTRAARVAASAALSPFGVTLAPDVLQPAGTNPSAWDELPTTTAGDAWQLQVWVWVVPGIQVTLQAAVFTGPYAGAATTDPAALAVTDPGASGWQQLQAAYTPTATGRWLGLTLTATNTATWAATPGTWASQPAGARWADYASFDADQADTITPATGGQTAVLVFSGRLSDMSAAWDDTTGGAVLEVTATDFLADLANRAVGDTPWVAERLDTRAKRILQLAAVPGEPPIQGDISPTVAGQQVSWHDVDHQPAAGLLADLAQSVDAVMWSATHAVSGPYLRMEDPSARPAMYQLELDGGVIVIDPAAFVGGEVPPLDLSACDLLRDPVTFHVDVGDVSSRVRIEWLEQTTDPDTGAPAPTTRVELVIDDDRETVYGTRAVSLSTLLTSQAAADSVAGRILARTAGDWRAAGVTVADADFTVPDEVAADALLRLLNGVQRGGLPVRITDMPDWNPISDPLPGYLEGGEYTFTGGGWELALIISRATGLGQSVTWNQMPTAWKWNQWDPSIAWNNLRGVSAPSTE